MDMDICSVFGGGILKTFLAFSYKVDVQNGVVHPDGRRWCGF